ncbi:MAG: Rdx family protein [Planctomycetales bacterium]|nr:Rdx family protein [Planctomycetales bacterium]
MAAALKGAFGIEAGLIEGSHGVFDIRLDGDLIFSKDELGRFPEHSEVILLIRNHQA